VPLPPEASPASRHVACQVAISAWRDAARIIRLHGTGTFPAAVALSGAWYRVTGCHVGETDPTPKRR